MINMVNLVMCIFSRECIKANGSEIYLFQVSHTNIIIQNIIFMISSFLLQYFQNLFLL